jgi:hypothetical protein
MGRGGKFAAEVLQILILGLLLFFNLLVAIFVLLGSKYTTPTPTPLCLNKAFNRAPLG